MIPDNLATVKVVWQALINVFKQTGVESPVADARLLVQWITGLTHEELLLKGDRPVTAEEQARLQHAIDRRMKAEPVSRIVGSRAFWKGEFKITPATLDPRADSETLIEAALAHVKDPENILDLGTGSGNLLLSLLMEYPNAQGVGLDISVEAVQVAGENARTLNLAKRATFLALNWENFNASPFDVVVSNPPYIAETERGDLAPEVLLYDPASALFAGLDGLMAYRSLARVLPKLLKPEGTVLLEIGYKQADSVKSILAEAGFNVVEVRRDLAGNDRVIVAKRA